MGKTKSLNVAKIGLAPYFKSLLLTDINKSDVLAWSFDERLNNTTQSSEGWSWFKFISLVLFSGLFTEVEIWY